MLLFSKTVLLLAVVSTDSALQRADAPVPTSPPSTRTTSQRDVFHGVAIADPYRWLENMDAPEVTHWVAQQAARTEAWLERLPHLKTFHDDIEKIMEGPHMGVPRPQGPLTVFDWNDGHQERHVLTKGDPLRPETWHPLLDPQNLSKDGRGSLTVTSLSPNAEFLVYGVTTAGEDWQTWFVKRLSDNTTLKESLRGIKDSRVAWLPDSSGFFYSRVQEPKQGRMVQKNGQNIVYFHRLGTPQTEDSKEFAHPDPDFDAEPYVSEDGQFLIVLVARGSERRHGIFTRPLNKPDTEWRRRIPEGQARFDYIFAEKQTLFCLTSLDAPKRRLVAFDLASDHPPKEILAELEDTLHAVTRVRTGWVASYIKDASSIIRVFDTAGRFTQEVSLPKLVWASGLNSASQGHTAYLEVTSNTLPPEIWSIEVGAQAQYVRSRQVFSRRLQEPLEDYVTYRLLAKTEQGHPLPLFVSHKKELPCLKDHSCPTRLSGYGGFALPSYPSFHAADLVWMKYGGVRVHAVIRGGGEYGDAWHESATGENKQKSFDDFWSDTQLLLQRGISRAEKIGIEGTSNGGLLVGAMLTQHPEGYGAVWCHAGVLDMLRFSRFTAGRGWIKEYGDVNKATEFKALAAYSPLHRVTAQTTYPSVLVSTGDHDDRVVPSHSYKFVAALQKAQSGDAPIFLEILRDDGHGHGTPRQQSIWRDAKKLAFFWQALAAKP